MKKIDWLIAENHRILDEMQHRTEVENEAFELTAQGKFEKARELVESLDDSLLELREWPGEEESENTETNTRDIRYSTQKASQAIAALTIPTISFEPAIKLRKTARKKDIHLKVKVKGNENVSEEELKEIQKEIAVAINKENRNRNKKISYEIII